MGSFGGLLLFSAFVATPGSAQEKAEVLDIRASAPASKDWAPPPTEPSGALSWRYTSITSCWFVCFSGKRKCQTDISNITVTYLVPFINDKKKHISQNYYESCKSRDERHNKT